MAIDESMDEVAKVPELFRSRLKERRSPGCAAPEPFFFFPNSKWKAPEPLATVAPTTRVEAASRPGWVRVSLPSLSPKKWIDDVKNGLKGRDNLGCGMGRMSGVAQKWYQDVVQLVDAREGTQGC